MSKENDVQKTITEILSQAEQLANNHNWSEAADLCIQARSIKSDDIKVLDQLGWYLSRAKRYEEAIKIYKELTDSEIKMAKWPYMLGYQYYDQKMWTDATYWFDQALQRRENYLIVLYRKGYAYSQMNETELAIKAFEKCISGWCSLTDGEEKEREAKNYSDACFQLGKQLFSSGQTRKAEYYLGEAIKYDSQDAYKFYDYGKALLRNGKHEEALDQFRIADKLEPRKDFIELYLARTYINLRKYEEAEMIFERIPERKRRDYVWRGIGELRLAQDRSEEAIIVLTKATKLDSQNHNSFYLLGKAYENCGKLSKANQAYNRAISVRQSKYGIEFPEARERITNLEKIAEESGIDLTVLEGDSSEVMGHIIRFVVDRGFGFIKRSDGEPDLFFHISDVINSEKIEVGIGVSYIIEISPKGPRAKNVSIIPETML
jgi:tetratricopeptide (TPR) repeat protein/cold shock CspA family protein